jgi:hypothetical protein
MSLIWFCIYNIAADWTPLVKTGLKNDKTAVTTIGRSASLIVETFFEPIYYVSRRWRQTSCGCSREILAIFFCAANSWKS